MPPAIPVPPQTHRRAADGDDQPANVSALHTPRQNQLLAALPPAVYDCLLPHLRSVVLLAGSTLHDAGEPETDAFFITAGIVTKCYLLESGETVEFAAVGNEGVIGVALFLDDGNTRSHALITSTGHAYRLSGKVLKSEFERNGPFQHVLLHYTQALIAQIAQTAMCNRYHSLEKRLCLWILLCLDRLPSNELAMTHEQIANVLGVRRESVTGAAGSLVTAGLIHGHRGTITVLDRPRLEERVCECYAVVKQEYDRLLPPAATVTALEGFAPPRS